MSAAGAVLNRAGLWYTRRYQKKTGNTLMYDSIYQKAEPFRITDWKPPKGYDNTEVPLSKSRGFLLKNKDLKAKRAVYHIHGGAYISAFSKSYNDTAVRYSRCFGNADVFSLDYRTAPENVYPCALEDALEGYECLQEMGYKPENIIICGDSAGGGLSLALCMKLRDRGDALPRALVLSSPWADLAAEGESYRTKITSDVFFGSYDASASPRYPVPIDYAGECDPHEPYISPVYGSFADLPPMLIQTGENELLLSDSETIAAKAEAAGTDVQFIVYPLMCHTFYIVVPWIAESKKAWQKIRTFMEACIDE